MFDADEVLRMFNALSKFAEPESLLRAVDRLGRSRTDLTTADQALDLGMAGEILLMHGSGQSTSEIAHKLSIRAAWLLGATLDERLETARKSKQLYSARSDAAHSGSLSKKTKFDRSESDRLITDACRAITEKGKFPDWDRLTLGG